VVRLRLSGDARVIVRPSGTEPKLKCYLEVVVPVTSSVDEARTKAAADLTALREAMAGALGL
jgi:phosphomannomutase